MVTASLTRRKRDRIQEASEGPVTILCSRRYLLVLLSLQVTVVAIVTTGMSYGGLHFAAIGLLLMAPVPIGLFFAKLNYRFELDELAIETVKPLARHLRSITPYTSIHEVDTRAGLLELALGVGTIVVKTFGRRITWPHISDHEGIAERLRRKLR